VTLREKMEGKFVDQLEDYAFRKGHMLKLSDDDIKAIAAVLAPKAISLIRGIVPEKRGLVKGELAYFNERQYVGDKAANEVIDKILEALEEKK